jgi:hypothetical protein
LFFHLVESRGHIGVTNIPEYFKPTTSIVDDGGLGCGDFLYRNEAAGLGPYQFDIKICAQASKKSQNFDSCPVGRMAAV